MYNINMSDITLHYFPLHGRGECIRMVFNYHGVPFNDHLIQFQEWPQVKMSGLAEFGQLPVLEIDGERMIQSKSVVRYVCQKYGYYPSNIKDAYLVESICDLKEDVLSLLAPLMFKKQVEDVQKWYNESAPIFLRQVERRLENNHGGNGFIVGNSVSMADFQIFQLVHDYFLKKGFEEQVAQHAPKLNQFMQRFPTTSATLRSYLKTREDRPF